MCPLRLTRGRRAHQSEDLFDDQVPASLLSAFKNRRARRRGEVFGSGAGFGGEEEEEKGEEGALRSWVALRNEGSELGA